MTVYTAWSNVYKHVAFHTKGAINKCYGDKFHEGVWCEDAAWSVWTMENEIRSAVQSIQVGKER